MRPPVVRLDSVLRLSDTERYTPEQEGSVVRHATCADGRAGGPCPEEGSRLPGQNVQQSDGVAMM